LEVFAGLDCGGTCDEHKNPTRHADRSDDGIETQATRFPPADDVFPSARVTLF
jgi:hypothetical protein